MFRLGGGNQRKNVEKQTDLVMSWCIVKPLLVPQPAAASEGNFSVNFTLYTDGVWKEDGAADIVDPWKNNDHITLMARIHCSDWVCMELKTEFRRVRKLEYAWIKKKKFQAVQEQCFRTSM